MKLLKISRAAKYLGMSPITLRKWTNAGKVKCYRVGDRKDRRFKVEDLKKLLK